MGVFDRIRNLVTPPAERRLIAAERAADAWQSAPAPSALVRADAGDPFAAQRRTAPRQAVDYTRDHPSAPRSFEFQAGYSDHVFEQFSSPLAFDGFDLDRIRSAVSQHRQGYYYESSTMMFALMSFAPILAALEQAIAPILALPRHIHGGEKGLAKLVASELREMLVPEAGLLPSPYFAPALLGTMAIYLRFMGFCVLQHVDGDPDEETGVRPRYTRIWEPWAVRKMRTPRKWLAVTSEGEIEIKNDGKFTMLIDENEGDLTGAIVALGPEALAGKITQDARNSFLDFFGKPKLWVMAPEKVATVGEAGAAFQASLEIMYGPDGRAVFPHGSQVDAVGISGQGSKAFQDGLLDVIIHCFMVLTGSAGTIGSGGPTGAGPYQPQKGGTWNVRHDLIARPTICIVRGINQGVNAPYCDMNYGDAIARAKRSGVWQYPCLHVPIPAPDRDDRIASLVKREEARTAIIDARRTSGIQVDQEEADHIADDLELRHVPLVSNARSPIEEWHVQQKVAAIDEAREDVGLEPLPNGAGSPQKLADDHARGLDKTGQVKVAEDKPAEEGGTPAGDATDVAPTDDAGAEPAQEATAEPEPDSTDNSGEDPPSTQRSGR